MTQATDVLAGGQQFFEVLLRALAVVLLWLKIRHRRKEKK